MKERREKQVKSKPSSRARNAGRNNPQGEGARSAGRRSTGGRSERRGSDQSR